MQWKEFSAGLRPFTTPELARIQKAFEFGETAHQGQKRLSGEPYFTHPTIVARKVSDWGADADTVIAALLHDTVEDTPTTRQTIAKQFGENVASLIHGMTKISTKELRGRPNLDIKIETLRKIFTAMEQDIRIMVIKLADRLHNMQTIISFPPAKQREYAQQTYDIYVKIADRLSMFSLRMELEALCLQILEPELYQKLDRLRLQNQKQGAMLLPDIEKSIRAVSKTPIRGIHFEDKTWQKLQTQLETGRSTTGISDLLLTIVVPDVDACYQMFGVLHQLWQREHLSFQDFINSPMINGYEGLHTTIILENGTRIRCKIRSEVMQRYSDYGVTTVCFGKDTAELPKNLPWTGRITPLAQATSDRSLEFWQSLQSDILGESIVVHAVDDQALLLPEGATVLDGVFYAYGADALRLKRVLVNGKEMALGSPLPNGVSLSLEIAPAVTARRQWLNWVKTGVATATIRTALASQPQLKKETIGKALLQQVLTEQGKGSIDEFNQASLTAGIQALGYANINEIFVAISDGRLEPGKAYQELFPRGRRHQAEASGQECSMQVYLPDDTVETVTAVLTVCKKYQAALRGLEPNVNTDRDVIMTLGATLTPDNQRRIVADLQAAGAIRVIVRRQQGRRRFVLFFIIMCLLWGLDPVIASRLLRTSLTAFDLTVLRYLVFSVSTMLLLAAQTILAPRRFKPLSLREPALFGAGIALFVTAFTTYLALTRITPTQYILFILAGTTVPSLLLPSFRRGSRRYALTALLLLLAGLIAIVVLQGTNIIGLAAAIVSSLGFALYSIYSRRYQEKGTTVRARFPAFLFLLSAIGIVPSLALLPFTNFAQATPLLIAKALIFLLVFTVVPYGIYYTLLLQKNSTRFGETLLLTAMPTIVAESLLSRSFVPLLALPTVLVTLWQTWQGAASTVSASNSPLE